jgi:phosphoribosyl 1,2-cyclic phosphate phosphodiesterase
MEGKLLFLGTGASTGVPVIGCSCPVCTSSNSKNHRLRSSALITLGNKELVLDVGPDFRQQALKYHIDHVDGVLITHAHYDHIGGIDDLRVLYYMQEKPIPCLLSKDTFEQMQKKLEHLFHQKTYKSSLTVQLDFTLLEKDSGKVNFLDIPLLYCSYFQGNAKVTGFRFGDLAYFTDIREFNEDICPSLQGVKTLIISALRWEASPVHFSIEEAIEFGVLADVPNLWITHVAHEIDYDEAVKKLPPHVHLAYDGLELPFQSF